MALGEKQVSGLRHAVAAASPQVVVRCQETIRVSCLFTGFCASIFIFDYSESRVFRNPQFFLLILYIAMR
jgi:hypothetical protein